MENLGGIREKGILLLPDLLRKGYIFKALGQAWLREDSFIDFVRRNVPGTFKGVGVLLLDVSDKMEIIDFLLPRIKQNCKKIS